MSNAQFSVAQLDPDLIKQNYIKWLGSQPQYSGYNFEGANFNVLLDLLSRNTFLEGFYVNMGFNETFLDSATLRDSVVSRAKEMNYCPSSMSSTSTSLDIVINTNGLTQFSIPFGTRFSGENSNGSYTFTTDDSYYQSSTTGNYHFANVMIYEGNYLSEVFSINKSVTNQRFPLSNPNIDTTSLKVLVSEDGGVTMKTYKMAQTIYNIDGDSTVFFLQAGKNNGYEVYFGDNVLGHQPIDGSVVQMFYRACSGTDADGVSTFALLDNLGTLNNGSILSASVTGNPTFGGTVVEDIETVRFRAPRNIQAQERAATASDYETLILKHFPQVGDVHAYRGGVTDTAVLYGTVLISAVTPAGNPLTETLKGQIIDYCSDLDLIHPSTQIVDASTLYIDVSTNIHVDFSISNNSIAFYKDNVSEAVKQFSGDNLQKYNKAVRYSKLSDAIDKVDTNGILGNELTLTLKRQIPITINTNTNIVTSFNNPVRDFNSDKFIMNGLSTYVTDTINNTSNGTLYNVYLNANSSVIKFDQIGSINYTTGSVAINNLRISQYMANNSSFFVYATPLNRDVYSANNDIIKIDPLTINVSVSNN